MTPTPGLTVIVPVYNARQFMDFTMKNIVEHQFSLLEPTDWELIVVDDGSTDGSCAVVEQWMERFPQSVRLLRQPNLGPAAARNVALRIARGEYVYFCDADDIIKRDAFRQIIDKVLPAGADLIKVRLATVTDAEYHRIISAVPEVEIPGSQPMLTVKEYLAESCGMVAGGENNIGSPLTFYRRGFLVENGLRFNTAFKNGEDELFTWSAILRARTVIDLHAVIYLYHLRDNSITHPVSRRQQARRDVEMISFATAMQPIIGELRTHDLVSPQLLELIRDEYRHIYYRSLTSMIVNPCASLSGIRKSIKGYRGAGGKIFEGHIKLKPYYNPKNLPLYARLRRIIAAYILNR